MTLGEGVALTGTLITVLGVFSGILHFLTRPIASDVKELKNDVKKLDKSYHDHKLFNAEHYITKDDCHCFQALRKVVENKNSR